MAKQELFNKEVHKPRGLRKKENKEFRKSGLHPRYVENKEQMPLDEMVDYILEKFYPEINFDEAENADCVKFATDTIGLTYGQAPDEVKN
jgi:hypothetical protein